MNNLYVLNADLAVVGIVDTYNSLIWRPSYYDVGDFELYAGASAQYIELLQPNRYIVRASDITVNNGYATYKKVMVIKNLELTTDVEDGDYITVTGRELKYLLHSRVVWSQTNLSGTAEEALRTLVTDNAILPEDPNRVIPRLSLQSEAGLTDTIRTQVTGAYLDEAISKICSALHYGWDVFIMGEDLVFEVYKGVDRSYNQTERPFVVFSAAYDNLYNTDYQLKTEGYANCSLIGGEGEGADRIFTSVGGDYAGMDRYEVYVDARDLSRDTGGTEEEAEPMPLEDYIEILQQRGIEKLADLSYTEGFSGEVVSNVSFKYGQDFFLGDTVTIISRYGVVKDVIVLSAIESEDLNGVKLIPQFNI